MRTLDEPREAESDYPNAVQPCGAAAAGRAPTDEPLRRAEEDLPDEEEELPATD